MTPHLNTDKKWLTFIALPHSVSVENKRTPLKKEGERRDIVNGREREREI